MLDDFFFSGHLEDDESIVRIVHRHWLMGLRGLFLPVAFILFGFAVLVVQHAPAALLIFGAWILLSCIWFLRNFLDYYLDAWIITNHGVIDLEWHGWFHRQSSRILYSDIQGISTEIQGIYATLLRFGTVTIEKISTGTTVSLSEVPRPRAIESLMLKNMETYIHSKNLKNSKHIEQLLSTMVAEKIQEESFIPKKSTAAKKRGFFS